MISLIVSAISIVIVMTVSVYIITKSYKENSERNQQLTKIVDQINSVNAENVNIDRLQNSNFVTINSNMITASNDIANIRQQYVSKTSLASDVTSAKGSFDALSLGAIRLSGHSNALTVNGGLSLASNVSIAIDASGNTNIATPLDKQFRLFNGTDASNGIIINSNLVGVGTVPKTSNGALQVSGAVWSSKGLMTTQNDVFASVVSYSNNAIQVNAESAFTNGVQFGPKASVNSASNIWTFDATSPSNGNSNLVLSRGPNGTPYVFGNNGRLVMTGEKSGLTVRGGSVGTNVTDSLTNGTTEFPGADGVNKIHGDVVMTGNIITSGDIRLDDISSPIDSYGIARNYNDNKMRVYSANGGSMNFSVLTDPTNRTFSDMVSFNAGGPSINGAKGTVDVNVPMKSQYSITTKASSVYSPSGQSWAMMANNNNDLIFANVVTGSVDQLTNDNTGAARIDPSGKLRASGLCLGDTCITAADLAIMREKANIP